MHKAAEASDNDDTARLAWGKHHDTKAFGQLMSVLHATSQKKMATHDVMGKEMWMPWLVKGSNG